MDKTPLISPDQCRAARALLGWKRSDLATKSEVSARALASFEGNDAKLMRANQRSIVDAFEVAGVEVIEGGVRWKGDAPPAGAVGEPPAAPRRSRRAAVPDAETLPTVETATLPAPLPPAPVALPETGEAEANALVMSEAKRLAAELLQRKAARKRGA